MPAPVNTPGTVTATEFEQLRAYIKKHCGIVIGDGKEYLIESRFAHLLIETGCSGFSEFYTQLTGGKFPDLRDKVIDAITTHETSWFRDQYPFDLLRREIIPTLVAQSSSDDKFKIWSCGCSTGQEPYSIAMTIDAAAEENDPLLPGLDRFDILATDISSSVLFLAAGGRYDKLAMKRGISQRQIERNFDTQGDIRVIKPHLKDAVFFKKMNILDSFTGLGKFDIIFCRNVLIYFSSELRTRLFENFSHILKPDGYLILGAAESTFGYTDHFDRYNIDEGTFYKLRGD